MESYIRTLIANLYDGFLVNDVEKMKTSKKLIEEATSLYESEGYSNSLAMELKLRLEKANNVLTETLVAKQEKEVELSKTIVENYYSTLILDVLHAISILESLIASYEKEPSEELASAIKDVAELENNRLLRHNYLLEENNSSIFSEEVEILKDYYSTFQELVKKINSF